MKRAYNRTLSTLMEIFDLGPTVALTVLVISTAILLTGIYFFIQSAPPTKLTISGGPEGSITHGIAQKYQTALAKNGIKVRILTSNGSYENLTRILDKKSKVGLALVQSGTEDESMKLDGIVSLGSISYQPLFFFYRGPVIDRLSQMKGRKIAIAKEGSGARRLSLRLLKLNGIDDKVTLVTLSKEDMTGALMKREVDGAFVMGEGASIKVLRNLLYEDDLHLFSFTNAAAYLRKVDILHRIDLPEGVIDFGENIPDKNVVLLGPMVELIARADLHPALSDMILTAAMEIHNPAGIFKKRNEFPMPAENRIPLSEDAARFYQSGKSFLYRYLPFWLASLINRLLVSFLPALLILIPVVRAIPALFRWMGQVRIRRRYRALLKIEERLRRESDPEKLRELNEQFEWIEKDVQGMKVRANFADQFYILRSHIDYVRRLMSTKAGV